MRLTELSPKLFPILGISLAVLFWIVDAFLDVYLFNNGQGLFKSIFTTAPHELWMRFSIVAVIIAFSLYAKKSEQTKSILLEKINSNDELESELEYLETVDPLTLLFNKRKFYELLEYEMEKDKRYKLGLSIIICSIDNYKNICGTHSNTITDNLLRNIALQLVKSLRTSDIVAKWSEEEFIIVIPNKTVEETQLIAEKIRNVIEQHSFEKIGKITTSLGVAQFIDDDNKVTIVNRANDALNKAQEKQNYVEAIK